MKNIAILASGNGTNAEAIISYFRDDPDVRIVLILSNRKDAYVLERARNNDIASQVLNRELFYDDHSLVDMMADYEVDLVVLAGFLWLIPPVLVEKFPGRIVNIHPALLPSYGGKGMYGMKVHEAVRQAGDTETGITVHLVNEQYDEGDIVFQARCPVGPDDSPEAIAAKVHELEYQYYPRIIESVLKNK